VEVERCLARRSELERSLDGHARSFQARLPPQQIAWLDGKGVVRMTLRLRRLAEGLPEQVEARGAAEEDRDVAGTLAAVLRRRTAESSERGLVDFHEVGSTEHV